MHEYVIVDFFNTHSVGMRGEGEGGEARFCVFFWTSAAESTVK